jgi:hypothetical protein
MNLIDDWTLGLIEMAECRSRYAASSGSAREREAIQSGSLLSEMPGTIFLERMGEAL